METRIDYTFGLNDDDDLSVCRMDDEVILTSCDVRDEFNIGFQPRHLPELRELVLELEALQTKQRQKEESANAAELSEKEVTA